MDAPHDDPAAADSALPELIPNAFGASFLLELDGGTVAHVQTAGGDVNRRSLDAIRSVCQAAANQLGKRADG